MKMNNNNIIAKNFLLDFQKSIFRRIQIVNLIKKYKKNSIKNRTQSMTMRLPRLSLSNSHRKIIFKRINKNPLNIKNSKEKLVNNDLTNIHEFNKENRTFRNIVKIRKNEFNIFTRNKKNKNYNNSKNIFSPKELNSKTTYNMNSNNRVRLYKIKNFENNKSLINEFSKVNNEYFVMRKNYYIRKNNINKDIFNLINKNNQEKLFYQTMSKSP